MMLRALWRRRVLSALLAAGVALGGLPGVGRAADEPDLKLEPGGVRLFVNAGGQVNDRVVRFKVTNVGTRDVPISEATGKLAVTSPPPASEVPLQNDKVIAKNGGSFQGVAPLPAPCDGTEVRVSLFAKGETNRANNTLGPLKLCPDQPKPAPAPGSGSITVREAIDIDRAVAVLTQDDPDIDYGGCAVCDIPLDLRDGQHTDAVPRGPATTGPFPAVVLDPSVSRMHEVERTNPGIFGCGPGFYDVDPARLRVPDPSVGFLFTDLAGCDINVVYQLILNFDLQWLRGVRNNVTRAELLFDEEVYVAKNNDGDPIEVDTCIGRLGLAPGDYPAVIDRKQLLATSPVDGVRLTIGLGEPSRWLVTNDVRYASAGHNPPLVGFVVHGLNENLNSESERECLSRVPTVRLKLEYEVFR